MKKQEIDVTGLHGVAGGDGDVSNVPGFSVVRGPRTEPRTGGGRQTDTRQTPRRTRRRRTASPEPQVIGRRPRIEARVSSASGRASYRIKMELGVIAALLVVIGLVRVPITWSEEPTFVPVEQELVQMEEVLQTRQDPVPPPPPRPPAPVVVPNDVVIEDVELDLDASLDVFEPLSEQLPPPPPPTEEEKEVTRDEEEEVFVVVEEMPELIGGLESIQQLIQYPEIARRAGVEGRVIVQFIVDKDGSVVDPVVVRGIGAGCDEEAVRAVLQARFKPGKQRGKPVRVRYAIPVTFELRERR